MMNLSHDARASAAVRILRDMEEDVAWCLRELNKAIAEGSPPHGGHRPVAMLRLSGVQRQMANTEAWSREARHRLHELLNAMDETPPDAVG